MYEYHRAILHAKTAVADDFLSLTGSSNLDFRSFHFNAECNVLMFDEQTGRTFSDAFEADLKESVEITPELWRQRSWRHRLGDALARRLGPIL